MIGRGIALVPFENMINKALRNMDYDTKTEVCGHDFRSMACSALLSQAYGQKTL